MKEKKILIILFSIILIFVILFVAILIAMKTMDSPTNTIFADIENSSNETKTEENTVEEVKANSDTMTKLTNLDEYYTIKNYINQYTMLIGSAYNYNYGEMKEEEKAVIKDNEVNYNEDLLNIIDKQATAELNLTNETVNTLFKKNYSYTITKVYRCETNKIEVFFTKGLAGNFYDETDFIKDYSIGIIVDKENKTYSILPYEYMKKVYPKISENIKYLGNFDEIKPNELNSFKLLASNSLGIARCYLGIYKACALYDKEMAWDLLNIQYRQKRYSKYDKFKKFLKYNSDDIQEMLLTKCEEQSSQYATCYNCIDKDNKEVVITQTNPLEFTIKFED